MTSEYVIITFEPITATGGMGIGKLSYSLAQHLHETGIPVRFICINKGPHQTSFPSEAVHWSSRYVLYALNAFRRLHWLSGVGQRKWEERYFDFFLSRKKLSGTVLVSTTAFIPRTLARHRQLERISYLPPTPNEQKIATLCREELADKGRPGATYHDAYTDHRRLQAFLRCLPRFRKIVSISPVTTKSYADSGIPVTEVPFLHIPTRSGAEGAVPQKAPGEKVIFLYVAYSVLLKGLHRLLEEWQLAAPANAELHILGPVEEQYRNAFPILNATDIPNVHYLGYAPNPTPFYLKADVVIIPSLIDGEPHTATEALSLGKPVLIADTCGYARFIGEQVPAAVFSSFKSGMLAGKIRQAADHPEAFTAQYQHLIRWVRERQFDYASFYNHLTEAVTSPAPPVPASGVQA
jgi:glycosyltransferase involved in cell wall biosynthesis